MGLIRLTETLNTYKISKPTLYKWIRNGCPVSYVGRMPYFDTEEVTAWIKSQKKGY